MSPWPFEEASSPRASRSWEEGRAGHGPEMPEPCLYLGHSPSFQEKGCVEQKGEGLKSERPESKSQPCSLLCDFPPLSLFPYVYNLNDNKTTTTTIIVISPLEPVSGDSKLTTDVKP